MNLSAPFINRPVMTTLAMVGILLFGIIAYIYLPISDLPNIDYPTITVQATQPGGSPTYMANLVALPLERNFATISGLNTMASNSTIGSTQIVLNFDLDVNLGSKETEVQTAITQALTDLPPMPHNPTYERTNPTDTPILFLTLTSSFHLLSDLYEIGYNILAQPLDMITGISQVQVYGFPYAVRVQADPMKLLAHQVDLNELATTLVQSNPNLPSGLLQGRYTDFILQTFGMLTAGEDYNKVMIKEVNGSPLYVGNVAKGMNALEQRDPYFRSITPTSDQNTVVLAASRLAGSNTLDISKAIFSELPKLKKNIPPSVQLNIFYEKAHAIIAAVHDVEITLLIALVLVVLVIFIYLGKLVDTLIPSVVLPMTIFATFIVMYLLGFSLDILSLLALTLAIGFIIDDSIVVLENIVRHVEMGKSAYQAAIDGSKQISITVLTMSLALAAVFIPFVWMPGILGRIFNEFSLTIVIAIFASGLISLSLNPMLCSRYLRERNVKKPNFSQRLNQKLIDKYERFLIRALRFKKTLLFIGLFCLGCSLLLLKMLPTDFIPPSNSSMVEGLLQCQQGSSRVNTNIHQREVDAILRKEAHQEGFVSIGGYPTDDQGVFYLKLKDSSKRPTALQFIQELSSKLKSVVGMNVYLKSFPLINLEVGNTSSLGEYQYTLVSTNQTALHKSAELMVEKMQAMKEITGVNSDMRTKSPQLNIHIDRDRAGLYNVTAEEIESTLRYAYSGGRIGVFNKGINLYDLIVEITPGYDLLKKDLDLLYIKANTTGELVPLKALASWEEVVAPSSISHINTFPSVTISFNMAQGSALGKVLKKIDQIAKEVLAPEVTGDVQGTAKIFIETFKSMKWLIVIALIVIYLVLGILYESFIHPLTILSTLPVAVFGGLLSLWLFGLPLSLFSVVGLIVLIGLVQKNGIIMIDFALEYLEKTDETPFQAIIEACKVRFRPILMTTLAAMMAALPVAIGFGENGDMNRPLGIVVFGGLIFSQLITLFVTPVVFLYMVEFQGLFKKNS